MSRTPDRESVDDSVGPPVQQHQGSSDEYDGHSQEEAAAVAALVPQERAHRPLRERQLLRDIVICLMLCCFRRAFRLGGAQFGLQRLDRLAQTHFG